ncbi:MAG: hypothetical protein Q9219_004914 [cf. Caloplaca sp. 3 TL-2023]
MTCNDDDDHNTSHDIDAKRIGKQEMMQVEETMISTSIQRLQAEIQTALDLGPGENTTKELLTRLETLREDVMVLKHELEALGDADPRTVDTKREETAAFKAEAERWTDNIMILEGWLRQRFGIDDRQLDRLRRECYGAEYVEGEALGKCKRDDQRDTATLALNIKGEGIGGDCEASGELKHYQDGRPQIWPSSKPTPDSEAKNSTWQMPFLRLTDLPPEVILRIFQHAENLATVNSLVRTSSIFHCIWLMNANSIALAVLPRSINCYREAQELVEVQEWAETFKPSFGGRRQSHREIVIVLIRRYFENAQLINSFYERNILPLLGNTDSRDGKSSSQPLLERQRFLATLYHLKTLAVMHQIGMVNPSFLHGIREHELVDLAEVASWFRRRATVRRYPGLGVEDLTESRWLQSWLDNRLAAIRAENRSCSCALQWLDAAGVFHRVCHACDSQKLKFKPGQSLLTDASNEPDLSWMKALPKRKIPNSSPQTRYSPIQLPTIEEVAGNKQNDVGEVRFSGLALETPVKQRQWSRPEPSTSKVEDVGSPTPDLLPCTPTGQPHTRFVGHFETAALPEDYSNNNEDTADSMPMPMTPKTRSAIQEKEDRLVRWSSRKKRPSDLFSGEMEKGWDAPTFEEWVEEEKRIKKKPRYAF